MEDFKYVDIFATKGIEYIAVIGFLITLVVFWKLLNKPGLQASADAIINKVKTTLVDWFYLANDFLYHQGHSWAMPKSSNVVLIGMDDFAQKLVGTPDTLSLPVAGTELKQGETGWRMHFNNKTIKMISPINGTVLETNEDVLQHPHLINEDPYQKGWLLKIKPSRLNIDKKNLLSGSLAKAWLENQVDIISSKVSDNYGVVLQDGGTIKNGFVKDLAPENWDVLAEEFFQSSE